MPYPLQLRLRLARRILAALVLWIAAAGAHAQAPAWQTVVVATGQTNGFSAASALAVDGSGNVYLAGSFSGTIVFGATALTSAGQSDVFVAKWNAGSQAFEWARQAGGADNDYVVDIAVNGSSIYLTGYYHSTAAQFGSLTLTTGGNGTNDYDVFVAKLTDRGGSGDFTWVQRLAGAGSDLAAGLAINGNSVYVAGSFSSPLFTAGSFALANAGGYDVFIAKLTDAGTTSAVAWAQQAGGPGGEQAFTLAVAGSQVYVAGGFAGTAAFGSGSLTSTGAQDVFVAKLTDGGASASFAWAQRAGGAGNDRATALAASGSNIYVAGTYDSGPASFGSTALARAGGTYGDTFITKLIDAGSTASFGWALGAGGTADDSPAALAVRGANVLMSGYFASAAISFGTTTLANPSTANEVFVTKVADSGATAQFAWAQRAGGVGNDSGEAVAVSGTTVYVAGATNPPASFGNLSVGTPTGTQVPFWASLADVTLATKSPALLAGFSVHPNPARANITVRLPAITDASRATLTLYDALGRPVHAWPVMMTAAGSSVEVPLVGVAPGLYLVQVQSGGQQASRALAVE